MKLKGLMKHEIKLTARNSIIVNLVVLGGGKN